MCWRRTTAQITKPDEMQSTSSAAAAAAAAADDDDADDTDSIHGSTLTFHDINYSVQVTDPDKFCGKLDKEILRDVR